MKKSTLHILFISVIILFIFSQMWVRFNTSLLMHDLDETIWSVSRKLSSPRRVQILIETAKEFGEYKHAYESSTFYILGALILLVLYIVSMLQKKE